ncbi:alpha/beta fold hydrolase [Jiella sp. M17.18]|uniref:alpha/beta fold hydrolase n=1 Tax=Jiella sp. M17.18 TaxID=3234247 RepID=UPI0034DE72C0
MLVHALGLDRRMWRDAVPHLARQYRVIAHDLRGHGHAAAAPLASDLGTYADDLVRLVDGLNLPKIHLVGLSLGGSIAQQVALSHPDRLESLTIIASTAWSNEAFSARADAAERDGLAAQVAPTLTRWFTPQALAENGWAVRYARDRIRRAFVSDWAAAWRALAAIETAGRLSEIAIPTHAIAGECDASTPPALMRCFQQIPGSIFEIIAGGPHMLSLENPVELSEAILRGLSATDANAGRKFEAA